MLQGYVIEGVTGAGKTRLLGELQRQLAERRPGSTRLILSEHYTERVLEDARARGELSLAEVLEHTASIVTHVQELFALKERSKFRGQGGNAAVQVLIERFIGSHFASLPALEAEHLRPSTEEWRELERQYACLARLRLLPVVLELPVPRIATAVAATRAHRNDAWAAYLDSLGDEREIIDHFIGWQERLLRFHERLGTPWRRLKVRGDEDEAAIGVLASDLVDALDGTA